MRNILRLIAVVVLLMITAANSFAQKEILLASTVNDIANSNIYETSSNVGYAAVTSKQFQRFELLTSLTTAEDLINIATNNSNAVVRLYALQALKRKKITIPENLKQQFQNDKKIVETLEGCLGDKQPVNLLALHEIKIPISF